MKENDLIYQLVTEDAQTVALETIGRVLTNEEMGKLHDIVADKMPWFEVIQEAIWDLGFCQCG